MRFWRDPSLFVVALAVGLFCTVENWALGPLSWIYAYGSGLETIPTILALSHDGQNFASWAPFTVGGADRMAFWGNASPFSVEYLFFAHLPTWAANGLYRFLQYFIAVYFTGRVLTDVFEQPRSWAAFGGIAIACFSYFTVGQLLTLPAVPLLIWLLERLFTKEAGVGAFALSGVAMSFTTTFTFGVPYFIAFATVWLVAGRAVRSLRGAFRLGVFFLGLIVPTALQLWAVAANAPGSQRSGWLIEPIGWSFGELFYTQLQYDFFNQDKLLSAITRTLPLTVFVAGSVWLIVSHLRGAALQKLERDYLRAAGLYLLFAQRWLWLVLQHAIVLVVPWAAGIYMGRFFETPSSFLIAVGFTLLGRIVWQRLALRPRTAFTTVVALLAVFMLVEPKRFSFYPLGIGDWGETNYRVAALDELARSTPRTDPFRVASVLPLQPAYAYAQGLEAADGWANIYASRYRELWLRMLAPLFAELPANRAVFGADSGKGEDGFVFLGTGLFNPGIGLLEGEDVTEALRSGFDIDRRFRIDLLKLLNVRYLLSEYPLRGRSLRLIHAPAVWPTWPLGRDKNTGLVNTPYPPLPSDAEGGNGLTGWAFRFQEALQRKRDGKDIFIYAIDGALPRAWLASEVRREDGPARVLDAVAALDDSTLGRVVILDTTDAANVANPTGGAGAVTITAYDPDSIELRVLTDGPGFLVVANTWSRFWTAEVDGRPTLLLRVNYAQMGVALDAGEHTVVLAYRPPYGAFFSLARMARPP